MKQGERQIGTSLDQISPDHVNRYAWAGRLLTGITTILDASCGTGYGSYILARQGYEVHGLDISLEALSHGNTHFNHPNVTTQTADLAAAWKTPSKHYDAVVCFETIEHLKDPLPVLKRFRELADTIICSVPNEEFIPFDKDKFPFHHRHYTPEQFRELITNAGFTHIETALQKDKRPGKVQPGEGGRNMIIVGTAI